MRAYKAVANSVPCAPAMRYDNFSLADVMITWVMKVKKVVGEKCLGSDRRGSTISHPSRVAPVNSTSNAGKTALVVVVDPSSIGRNPDQGSQARRLLRRHTVGGSLELDRRGLNRFDPYDDGDAGEVSPQSDL